jgi:hypothetical protein
VAVGHRPLDHAKHSFGRDIAQSDLGHPGARLIRARLRKLPG